MIKWLLILAAELAAFALFLAWCDWQNAEHNRAFPRGFWAHVERRVTGR